MDERSGFSLKVVRAVSRGSTAATPAVVAVTATGGSHAAAVPPARLSEAAAAGSGYP